MGEAIGFNSSKASDGWDWAWFRYGSTVILNNKKWEQLTPREFNSLMKVHVYINDPKSKDKIEKNTLTPIDKVPGW